METLSERERLFDRDPAHVIVVDPPRNRAWDGQWIALKFMLGIGLIYTLVVGIADLA